MAPLYNPSGFSGSGTVNKYPRFSAAKVLGDGLIRQNVAADELYLNELSVRNFAGYNLLKASGSTGFLFNSSDDSRNIARITDSGFGFFGLTTDGDHGFGSPAILAKSTASTNGVKEFISAFYKNSTNKTGVALASTDTVSYVHAFTYGTNSADLVLGGILTGSTRETLTLKSDHTSEFVSDVKITDTTKGFVLRAPDGTYFRLRIDNAGVISTAAI